MTSEPWWCGERIILTPAPRTGRIIVSCVEQPGHTPDSAHRSGTLPVIRWRTNPANAAVLDVWVEHRNQQGHSAGLMIVDDLAGRP